MRSPLSRIIAFTESFEEQAIELFPQIPTCWFRIEDHIFVIWPHGPKSLQRFLNHSNSYHAKIHFAMKVEEDGKLSFLDVLVSCSLDGNLDRTVYRKPTHTT